MPPGVTMPAPVMTTAIHPAAPLSTVTGQCTCALQVAVLSNDMQQRATVSSTTCLASLLI